jgi:hypothetical protein
MIGLNQVGFYRAVPRPGKFLALLLTVWKIMVASIKIGIASRVVGLHVEVPRHYAALTWVQPTSALVAHWSR